MPCFVSSQLDLHILRDTQSVDAPADLMGPAHFSISRAKKLARYSGLRRSAATGVAPSASSRSRTVAVSSVSPKAALRRRTIASGVPAGKNMACQLDV